MKIRLPIIGIVGFFSLSAPPLHAQEKTTREGTAEVWDKTKQTSKELGNAVAKKTKETVSAVEDVIDKPDADAHTVNVIVTEKGVQMPKNVPAGKTAFVVKNTARRSTTSRSKATTLRRAFG